LGFVHRLPADQHRRPRTAPGAGRGPADRLPDAAADALHRGRRDDDAIHLPAARRARRASSTGPDGCEIGNSFIDQDAGLAVGEWVFPRPVQAGELVCFDFEIDWVSSDPLDRCFERLLADQAQILSIQVEFTGRPPARARRQLRANHDTDMLVDEPLPVDGNQVTSLVVDPQPGVHGVRWEF